MVVGTSGQDGQSVRRKVEGAPSQERLLRGTKHGCGHVTVPPLMVGMAAPDNRRKAGVAFYPHAVSY